MSYLLQRLESYNLDSPVLLWVRSELRKMRTLTDAEWSAIQDCLKKGQARNKELKEYIRLLTNELERWVGKESEYGMSGGMLDDGRNLIRDILDQGSHEL